MFSREITPTERGAAYPLGAYGSSLRRLGSALSSNLVWVPSVLASLLAASGFCLCWYRLMRLERVAENLEEQVGAAARRLGTLSDTLNSIEATLEALSKTVTQIEDRSSFDHQTGLRSGRLFPQDAAMLCRSSSAVAVLLIDLDVGRYTKHGQREPGDRALLAAAHALRDSLLREGDRLYRMPDAVANFLVLLPVDDFAEAYQHAERLRTALEGASVPASIGIAYADRTAQQRDPRRLQALAATHREAAKTKGLAIYPKPALSDLAAAFPAPVAIETGNETTAQNVGAAGHGQT